MAEVWQFERKNVLEDNQQPLSLMPFRECPSAFVLEHVAKWREDHPTCVRRLFSQFGFGASFALSALETAWFALPFFYHVIGSFCHSSETDERIHTTLVNLFLSVTIFWYSALFFAKIFLFQLLNLFPLHMK